MTNLQKMNKTISQSQKIYFLRNYSAIMYLIISYIIILS